MFRSLLLFGLFGMVFTCVAPSTPYAQNNGDDLWPTRCVGISRDAQTLACETNQAVRIQDKNQLLFQITIIYSPETPKPVFQMQAPHGFYLPGKINLKVDGTEISVLEIGTCDNRGCFLATDATPAMIDAMKAGTMLQIDFAATVNRRQSIDIPLAGFTRAINAIQ